LLVLSLGCSETVLPADLNAVVQDDGGNPVQDAVVLATPSRLTPRVKPGSAIVDQIDKEFVPYVTPIVVGSFVSFPNKDNIRHHVYSFSPAKRFELPLYSGTPSSPILFDKPGVVALGCNIHDWMIGYIYVAETPYFGKTGATGTVKLANLPPGDYTVRIWHPRMNGIEESTSQRFDLKADSVVQASWRLGLKPEIRPRRAPVSGSRDYR
jgi:plastocyanin